MASVELSETAEMGVLAGLEKPDTSWSPLSRLWALEESFSMEETLVWMRDHRPHLVSLVTLYITAVFLMPRIMKNRRPIPCQWAANLWNSMLAVFSWYCFYRMTPEYFGALRDTGFRGSYCQAGDYYKYNHGFWVWLFHMSKLVELGDTVWLLLKKRPVLFLHWYHHVVVLVDSWFSYVTAGGMTRWGTWMNLAVHSTMYTYFALSGLYGRMPRWIARLVTCMQITQFVVGTTICSFVFVQMVVLAKHTYCDVYVNAMSVHLMMYVSFLLLFCHFFYNAYMKRKQVQAKKED